MKIIYIHEQGFRERLSVKNELWWDAKYIRNLNQSLNLIDNNQKCEKIVIFWSKINFSVQGLGLFYRKKRVTFVVMSGFWSIEIVSEPATPA